VSFKRRFIGSSAQLGTGVVTSAIIQDGGIVDADVNAAAAIAKSKLAALGIVDADVAAGAAIAKSKLAALGIVDADIAGGAAIAKAKLAALAIANADVAANAAIALSKLGVPTFNLLAGAPAFATPTMVAGAWGRLYFGYFNLTSAATLVAQINVKVETGVGTAVYSDAVIAGLPITQANTPVPYAFWVPTGCRFQLTKTGNVGTTETVGTMSYLEV
jgi:hypothetical protein